MLERIKRREMSGLYLSREISITWSLGWMQGHDDILYGFLGEGYENVQCMGRAESPDGL